MMTPKFLPAPIQGSGGGKKGGGKGGGASTASTVTYPNSLQSDTQIQVIELISEGPIVGLVNGGNSILFGNTPVVNPDATVNFHGVSWNFQNGGPDQMPFPGNSGAQTVFNVGTEVLAELSIVRTIDDANTTSVIIITEIPALMSTYNGSTYPWTVGWMVEVQPVDGAWTTVVNRTIYGVCSSPVYIQDSFVLPVGGFPWNIRYSRTIANQNGTTFIGQTFFSSYIEVVEAQLTYPYSAVVALEVDAAYFGSSSLPTRSYAVKGLIIEVPSNYDPIARTYTGVWDGTFKNAWTNNPAWILRDLLVNNRYGLGQFLSADMVDIWGLYAIAQYCDGQVSDGYGGMETRYTMNIQIMDQQEAFKVIQTIAAAFRGMAFWSLSQVFCVADMPADPIKLYSPANVIGGHFEYSGTAMTSRHSVALVTWYDPSNFYIAAVEVVIDDALLQKFGWRQLVIDARGCTTRAMANRYGRWAIDTEETATDTVQFSASFDSANIVPGDIIAIADPYKAEVRAGGRIIAISGNYVTIDAPFVPGVGETYNLLVELPDGSIATGAIYGFDVTNTIIELETAFSPQPQIAAMFVISGTDVEPRQFTVLSRNETAPNIFQITGLFYDPTKFARIEQDINFNPVNYYRPPTTIMPPSNMTFNESVFLTNGVGSNNLTVSWTPGPDFLAVSYQVSALTPNGFVSYGSVSQATFTLNNPTVGEYTFYVSDVGLAGLVSTPLTASYTVTSWTGQPTPTVSNLEIAGQGNSTTFGGQNCTVVWNNNFPITSYDYGAAGEPAGGQPNPFYRDNLVQIYDPTGQTLLSTWSTTTNTFEYTFAQNTADNAPFNQPAQRSFLIVVTVRDTLGNESQPVSILCDNPVPAMIIPNVTASLSTIYVNYPPPADLDYSGSIIWLSTTQNFNPLTTTPVYNGALNAVSFPAASFTTYYVMLACYDAFNQLNLNICPAIAITVGGVLVDTTPPPVPTGLALTTSASLNADGTLMVDLNATWAPTPEMTPPAGAPPGWYNNFAYFNVSISQNGGAYVSYQTALPSFSWDGLVADTPYSVEVAAVSQNGYSSYFCSSVSITSAAQTTGPAAPTSFTVAASLKSAYLQWINPSNTDLAGVQIWQSMDSVEADAVLVGSVSGQAFTVSGLTTGTAYNYWLRPFNTSGLFGAYVGPVSVTPGQVANGDIAASAITADKILAGTITGDRLNVSTSFPATITVGSSGITMGAMLNPANLINAGSTTINPGQILIAGSTTLANWQQGGDTTKISGGAISANTIAANALTIGLRGITVTGIQFSFDGSNNLNWTAGAIGYVDNSGTAQNVAISAGTAAWTTGTLYVGWAMGATTLVTNTAPYSAATYVALAVYSGGTYLVADYGQTTITGAMIVTGSITAAQIQTGTITAAQIAAGTITATQIAANSVTFDKMAGGTISASTAIYLGGTTFELSATNQQLIIQDAQLTPVTRVIIGNLTGGASNYGAEFFNAAGALIFSTGGGISAAAISPGLIVDSMITSIAASKIVATSLSAISANLGTITAGQASDAAGMFVINFTNANLIVSD